MDWIIIYDKLSLVLESLFYKSKLQVSKDKLVTAMLVLQNIEKNPIIKSVPNVELNFKIINLASSATNDLHEGAIDDRIKDYLCAAIRNIQIAIADTIFDKYEDRDIQMDLTQHRVDILRQIVADHYLRSTELA